MCHPAIPMLMMAAGTYLKKEKAGKAISAQDDYSATELTNQKRLEDEARGSQEASLAKFDPDNEMGTSKSSENTRLSNLYAASAAGIEGLGGGGGGGPAIITEGDALVDAQVASALNARAGNMAQMDAFGSAFAPAASNLNLSAAKTGMMGNLMGASSNVYGREMENAYKEGYSTLGDLLQMGGGAAMSSSLRKPGNKVVPGSTPAPDPAPYTTYNAYPKYNPYGSPRVMGLVPGH
jgi:hypothetical protein